MVAPCILFGPPIAMIVSVISLLKETPKGYALAGLLIGISFYGFLWLALC